MNALNIMEEVWKSVSQEKDGRRTIHYKNIGDLAILYMGGFVDVSRFTFKEWVSAFDSSRKPDGSYLITHEQWMAKEKFRYSGPIGDLFDPMTLADAELTEEEFFKFLLVVIFPHTTLLAETAPQIVANCQKMGLYQNGKVLFNQECKKGLLSILNTYPSPRRVQQLIAQQLQNSNQISFQNSTPQSSGFTKGISAEKTITSRFSEIAKELKKENFEIDPNAPVFSIKELKKKTPGRI